MMRLMKLSAANSHNNNIIIKLPVANRPTQNILIIIMDTTDTLDLE